MNNEWQYHLVKGISWLVCRLPYKLILLIGASLGPVYGLIAKKQKLRGIKNIKIGMNMNDQEAEQLIDKLFKNLGRSVMEVLYMPNLTKSFIDEHIEMRGVEYLEEAIAEDKGVIVLTGHVGNWEWMGAAMAAHGYPSTTIVKKQPNAQFTRLMNEYREMVGLDVFASGGNEIVSAAKALKKKKLLGFLADQDGYIHGLPVPFLGQDSSAVIGPATFAKKFGSPVVPIFASRKPEGGHIVHILPALHYIETGDEDADMYRLTEECVRVTEDFIRQHPDEWLWFQHRWMTKMDQIINYDKKIAVRERAHEKQ